MRRGAGAGPEDVSHSSHTTTFHQQDVLDGDHVATTTTLHFAAFVASRPVLRIAAQLLMIGGPLHHFTASLSSLAPDTKHPPTLLSGHLVFLFPLFLADGAACRSAHSAAHSARPHTTPPAGGGVMGCEERERHLRRLLGLAEWAGVLQLESSFAQHFRHMDRCCVCLRRGAFVDGEPPQIQQRGSAGRPQNKEPPRLQQRAIRSGVATPEDLVGGAKACVGDGV